MRSVAVVLVVSLGACSFATVKSAPTTLDGDTVLDCTTGRGAVAVDTLFTLLHVGILTGIAVNDPTDNPLGLLGAGMLLAPFTLGAIVHGSSAVYGHTEVSKCERAVQEATNQARSPISPTPTSATSGMF